MASSLSLHQHTIYSLSPTPTLGFGKYPHHISILPSFRKNFLKFDSPTTVPFAVTESDSPKSLEPDPQTLLQQVAESFVLPADFFSQLPRDLRLDLNDAAFDLSNGPVKDEIAKVMIKTGKLLSASPVSGVEGEEFKQQTRMFKFGDLQVELTSGKAYTGAAIAVIFSFLSWELSQGIQSIPESSLQYANDNALLLAKSLRASLLVMSYSSTVLAAFATVGLILLGGQLKSENK
ncbi:hypothetical protein AABB24_007780 [Solanum stoloniferum]|uniref:Uncharacterized protein n=1 Tax=Solanum stoloniferum TaxID=62892 RepID=A0ABD2UR59_9SOLN